MPVDLTVRNQSNHKTPRPFRCQGVCGLLWFLVQRVDRRSGRRTSESATTLRSVYHGGAPLASPCVLFLRIFLRVRYSPAPPPDSTFSLVNSGGPWYNRCVLDARLWSWDCLVGSPSGRSFGSSFIGGGGKRMTFEELVCFLNLIVQILILADRLYSHRRR